MRAALPLLALASCAPLAGADTGRFLAPTYSSASIVNSATNEPGQLAPNTIATIYGVELSFSTRAITADDVAGGTMPFALPGTGVTVLVGNIPAGVYYVSPTQVNVVIPSNLTPGRRPLRVVRDGRAGPEVEIVLRDAAPALYQLDQATAVAAHPDGSVIDPAHPARPGDIIVLYATGLGRTVPDPAPGEILRHAAWLADLSQFHVFLDTAELPAENLLYAGIAPGFSGLYQVNLRLPEETGPDPEIRLAAGGASSPAGIRIPVERNP